MSITIPDGPPPDHDPTPEEISAAVRERLREEQSLHIEEIRAEQAKVRAEYAARMEARQAKEAEAAASALAEAQAARDARRGIRREPAPPPVPPAPEVDDPNDPRTHIPAPDVEAFRVPPVVVTYLCPGCSEEIEIPVNAVTVKCRIDQHPYPWPDIMVHTVKTWAHRAEAAARGVWAP